MTRSPYIVQLVLAISFLKIVLSLQLSKGIEGFAELFREDEKHCLGMKRILIVAVYFKH